MASRVLPVGLLLLTLVVDAEGLHQVGFYVLVFALTAAAVSALSLFGDLVELPGRAPGVALARLEVACGGLGALLVLVAAAARGQTAAADAVPALAVSATVGALLFLGPVLVAAAVRTAGPTLRRSLAR
jgi:hypothetical protein